MPMTVCWHCDRPMDCMSPLEDGTLPKPGSISLCLYCGAVAVIGPELLLYPPSEAELDEMKEDREFMNNYMSFAWARQYLMIHHNLLRQGEDPDR